MDNRLTTKTPDPPDPFSRRLLAALLVLTLGGCGQTAVLPKGPPLETAAAAADEFEAGLLVLSSPSLLAGIPGSGELTSEQLAAWLADEGNHRPLEVTLPRHLRPSDAAATAIEFPADNSLTRARVELGRQLFFDRRLSRGGRLCCADCHHPRRHFATYLAKDGPLRDPLPAVNRLLAPAHFWDGRAASLEEQAAGPLENLHELDLPAAELTGRLAAIEGYRRQFERIFGRLELHEVCQALACFQRAAVSLPAAWDLGQAGPAARRGAALFFGERGGCSRCHAGPNFSDEQFHNVGTGAGAKSDEGRYAVTRREADRGAFKTPTLRNVAQTFPYGHDARWLSLAEAVAWFAGVGAHSAAGNELTPLDLTAAEQQDLVAFLESLSSPPPPVETGRLPQ